MSRVAWTTVIRATAPGEVHGALGFADLERGEATVALYWDAPIATELRGGPRGLRGVLQHRNRLWVGTYDAILEFNLDLDLQAIHRHPCLAHVHELAPWGDSILVVSTDFDCVLSLDCVTGRWPWGLLIRGQPDAPTIRTFDPDTAPVQAGDTSHLNQVHADGESLWIGGTQLPYLIHMAHGQATVAAPLPLGTHNAQPIPGGVLYCDTESDRVVQRATESQFIATPRMPLSRVTQLHAADAQLARIGFTRGLLALDAHRVVFGSAPACLHLANFAAGTVHTPLTLSTDVRASVHGLCHWTPPLPTGAARHTGDLEDRPPSPPEATG